METNLFDYISSRIFSQLGKDGLLPLVVYFLKNLNPVKYNYKIYDKKLLAIICCFEQWRPKLKGKGVLIKVITNHKNLKYFIIIK